MRRTVIVDADSLVYSAARANEQEIQWEWDLWTTHCFFEPARMTLENDVEQIKEALDADEIIMALSDYEKPWRKQIMPSYKSNRKDVRKPVVYRPLREYIHEAFTTYQRPGLEGDDVCGILLSSPDLYPGEKTAISLDKDFQTLPGRHLNMTRSLDKGEWFATTVSEALANYNHMKQSVSGDVTDGYSGCPGIGPVSAAKLLAPFHDEAFEHFDVKGAWKAIVAAYAKKGLSEEVALQNARVARICRAEDFDFNKKEVILWNPPQ